MMFTLLQEHIPAPLAKIIAGNYKLNPEGTHGVRHWIRVWDNGRELAASTGANIEVVRLFAFLHDSCRQDEDEDYHHGPRAAKWIRDWMQPENYGLTQDDFELLIFAIAKHTHGETKAHPTVMTCWDADRLDIGRVGFTINKRYLCTDAAKAQEMIRKAYKASTVR